MRKTQIIRRRWWKSDPSDILYAQHSRGDIACEDALEFLHALKSEIADIIFLDPPFNLGKKYGQRAPRADRMDSDTYVRYMTQVLLRCCEVLKEGGALYLYHIPRFAIDFAHTLTTNLEFRHWIAIAMNCACRP